MGGAARTGSGTSRRAAARRALRGRPDHYELLQMGLVARLGGALWLIGAALAAALTLAHPPETAGALSWPLWGACIALALAAGVLMIRAGERIRPRELLAAAYPAPLLIGLLDWLAGAPSPYAGLMLLVVLYNSAVHPPRHALGILAVVASVALAPLVHTAWAPAALVTTLVQLTMWGGLAVLVLVWCARTRDLRRDLEVRRREAAELARLDPLTRLGNRRALGEALGAAVAAARRTGRSLSVLATDLDGFKAINDRHGHPAGDAALVSVAGMARAASRLPDAWFRWGGDEFVAVLRDTGRDDAHAVGQRVARAIAAACADPDGLPLRISVGCAELGPGMTPDDLVAAADADLLGRKAAPRSPLMPARASAPAGASRAGDAPGSPGTAPARAAR